MPRSTQPTVQTIWSFCEDSIRPFGPVGCEGTQPLRTTTTHGDGLQAGWAELRSAKRSQERQRRQHRPDGGPASPYGTRPRRRHRPTRGSASPYGHGHHGRVYVSAAACKPGRRVGVVTLPSSHQAPIRDPSDQPVRRSQWTGVRQPRYASPQDHRSRPHSLPGRPSCPRRAVR